MAFLNTVNPSSDKVGPPHGLESLLNPASWSIEK